MLAQLPPTNYEALNAHFASLKLLFDPGSINVVEATAQPTSGKGSQIVVVTEEKHCFREIMFLGQSIHEHTGWIGASSFEDCDIKN